MGENIYKWYDQKGLVTKIWNEYLKWISNKDLLYSTKNSAQYYVTI